MSTPQTSPATNRSATSSLAPSRGTTTTRPTSDIPASTSRASAGSKSILGGQGVSDAHLFAAAEDAHTSPQASSQAASKVLPPAGTRAGHAHDQRDTHIESGVAPSSLDDQEGGDVHCRPVVEGQSGDQRAAANSKPTPTSAAPLLADPVLALLADALDDIEKIRIAQENRLRQLTRTGEDKDGEVRGFEMPATDPTVARFIGVVTALKCDSSIARELTGEKLPKREGCCLEHDAERNLTKRLKAHALHPFLAALKGVGDKQAGRLLAAIGDPYIRPPLDTDNGVEPARPRMVSELWAYSGLHVIFPAGQRVPGDQTTGASGDQAGDDTGHRHGGHHSTAAGVAATRSKGQRARWNAAARMRVYNIAESCNKQRCANCTAAERGRREKANVAAPWAPPPADCTCEADGYRYRVIYDQGRIKYADATHKGACVRCGPKGKPAAAGSPLSDAHKHARARRLVMKELLKDLWREAKRLHEATLDGQGGIGAHGGPAVEGQTPQ